MAKNISHPYEALTKTVVTKLETNNDLKYLYALTQRFSLTKTIGPSTNMCITVPQCTK